METIMALKISSILAFLHRANQLKSIRRFRSSLKKNGDSVAEHSWRLALMAIVVAQEFDINIDMEKALLMALIHDLPESKTGDIDAYDVIKNPKIAEEKREKETEAMEEIVKGISFAQKIKKIWEEYEDQETLEAKYIKALDKIEAYMHLDERGTSVYIPKEFHSDYADAAVKAFDEAEHKFPPLELLLKQVKEELKKKFKDANVKWVE